MNNAPHLFLKGGSSAERSAREARHLQALSGPGIVRLQGRSDGGELLLENAACSLADVLHERGPLPADEIRAVGAAAAAALARVHQAGLVHGDVKPANLLLSRSGELLLADFDSAAPADGQPLACSSPPRLAPGAPARPATDVCALAITLVELSTGALIDPGVAWRAGDLRRLGCSHALSAEIAFMLSGNGSALSARGAADMFERGGAGSLPMPAMHARRVDPTPTVEFMPARARTPTPPALPDSLPASAAAEPASRWWRRLAASWRSGDASPHASGRFGDQASGISQANRSS